MKEAFLNHTMNFIASNQETLNEAEREKLQYGLEGLYITITKLVVIFLIAFLLGFIKEFIIALILFNILRFPGFGFHASKSIVCLITSTLLILGLPYLFTNIEVGLTIKIVLCIISFITFIICAPADTWKIRIHDEHHSRHRIRQRGTDGLRRRTGLCPGRPDRNNRVLQIPALAPGALPPPYPADTGRLHHRLAGKSMAMEQYA